jgi:hypothetical protein
MKHEQIRQKVFSGAYVYTLHADIERKADDLAFYQIEEALLSPDKEKKE